MNKLDLQKVIREEVKKALTETYRDAKENVAILHAMMKKGGKDAKRAKEIVKDIKDELSVIMSTTDPKANLKLVDKVPELDEYLDDAIEMALDDGMGRARGMMGSMQGMREGVKKSLKENSAPVITEAATTMTVSIPGAFISALKKFLSEAKQDADQGDTYYIMTPGKENALIGVVFSNWIASTMNAIDSYELMDNFDSDLEIMDDNGMAAKLAKKGLLTKKVK